MNVNFISKIRLVVAVLLTGAVTAPAAFAGWTVTYEGAGYATHVVETNGSQAVLLGASVPGGSAYSPLYGASYSGLAVMRYVGAMISYSPHLDLHYTNTLEHPTATGTFVPIFSWSPDGTSPQQQIPPKELIYQEVSLCHGFVATWGGNHGEVGDPRDEISVSDGSDTPITSPLPETDPFFKCFKQKLRTRLVRIEVTNPCRQPGNPVYLFASAQYSANVDYPGGYGNQKVAAVAFGAVPLSPPLSVRRLDSGGSFGQSTYIAAGAKETSEHQAEVRVSTGYPNTDLSISTPTIEGGEGRGGGRAYIVRNENKVTDANGDMVIGVLHSSDKLEGLVLRPPWVSPGDSNVAVVTQLWDQIGEWKNDIFFRYNEAKKVRFKPKFHDYSMTGYPAVKIKQHQMQFKPTAIDILVWSGGDYVSRHLRADSEDAHERWLVENYAVFDSGPVQDAGDGVYETGLTVKYDKHRAVTNVDIGVKDLGVFQDVPKPAP